MHLVCLYNQIHVDGPERFIILTRVRVNVCIWLGVYTRVCMCIYLFSPLFLPRSCLLLVSILRYLHRECCVYSRPHESPTVRFHLCSHIIFVDSSRNHVITVSKRPEMFFRTADMNS